jgi:hypothetical protein
MKTWINSHKQNTQISRTSHRGYCRATSAAQQAFPVPQSRTRRREGNLSAGRTSTPWNFMRKTSCINWRRCPSYYFLLIFDKAVQGPQEARRAWNAHLINRPEIRVVFHGKLVVFPITAIPGISDYSLGYIGKYGGIWRLSGKILLPIKQHMLSNRPKGARRKPRGCLLVYERVVELVWELIGLVARRAFSNTEHPGRYRSLSYSLIEACIWFWLPL